MQLNKLYGWYDGIIQLIVFLLIYFQVLVHPHFPDLFKTQRFITWRDRAIYPTRLTLSKMNKLFLLVVSINTLF